MVKVKGRIGAFSIQVRKNPRYIDMDKCIACGICAQKCPKKVDDAFNEGINRRKAAYIQYGQTVPLKYLIDPEACLYLTKGKCRACEKFCPTGAIHFEDRAEVVDLQVGAVILAPGFSAFDPGPYEFYGYKALPDVVTSLEYERLLSASGPCMGHLTRPSDQKEPRKIAWIQCVGSRSTNRCDNAYCSSVCCMYALKQSLVTAEHLSGDGVEQTIFYMDLRSHGKEFERYYEDAKAKGVAFVQARPHTIMPGEGNRGVRLTYTATDGSQVETAFDMLVLSVGLEAPPDAGILADRFGFELDEYRFARTTNTDPVKSSRQGIFVTGAFQSPKAIPRSVTEASAASAAAAIALADAKGSLTKEKVYPPELDLVGQEARIGVFICACGINIAGVVDVETVGAYAAGLPGVVMVENNLFTCATDTQTLIARKIEEHRLNRVVVAACTPRTHEPLFQDTLREAGVNPYLFEMANIRNHNAWVHQKRPDEATAKAKDQVRMAVAKAALSAPLSPASVTVTQRALVVGGGLAGMSAALGLADMGFKTLLVECQERLGGNAWRLKNSYKGESISAMTESRIAAVEAHPAIRVLKQSRVTKVSGSVGNFSADLEVAGERETVTFGAAILATGAREYRPADRLYGYGQDPRIRTHQQFDILLKTQPPALTDASTVVFIQCVGSREPRRPYCSRLCCTHTVKSAITLKSLKPAMNVYVLYRDMRTYGKREALYAQARRQGVVFIRYEADAKPQVEVADAAINVKTFDPILQLPVEIKAEHLVLATGIVPQANAEIFEMFKCSVNADGFVNEAHPKLRPVDASVEGLFVAGMCNYPKPAEESLVQARAAVARAAAILSRKRMTLDPIKSQVNDRCDGCALCVDVCPFRAIALVELEADGETQRRVQTDPALCKGCGLCSATCPKGGIEVLGFTRTQLKSQIEAALAPVRERAHVRREGAQVRREGAQVRREGAQVRRE
ncbi:MAG: FAD-dependent oxidoreductase, partial [Desulfosarcinaceae bacterium]